MGVSWPDNVEWKKLGPGRYLVEGHLVTRSLTIGSKSWHIWSGIDNTSEVTYIAPTLSKAIDFIADQKGIA